MSHSTAPALRLAEVLGALSLATDLANGQPSEHALRTAILAVRLAQDEPADVRRDVYWSGLLRYLGCSGFAVEEAAYAGGDDIGLRMSFIRADLGRPSEFIGAVLRDVGRGAPPWQRAKGVLRLLSDPQAPRAHALAQCDAAEHCGRKLGMPAGVPQALAHRDERYDGRGFPGHLAGDALSLPRFANAAPQLCAGLEQDSVWDDFLDSEPGANGARQVLLEGVAQGRLCRHAVDAVLSAAGQVPARQASTGETLTEREIEVLRLLVLGLTNKQIGRQLGISPRTVQHHTIHIYGKSGVKSRAGAALWAVERGLLLGGSLRG